MTEKSNNVVDLCCKLFGGLVFGLAFLRIVSRSRLLGQFASECEWIETNVGLVSVVCVIMIHVCDANLLGVQILIECFCFSNVFLDVFVCFWDRFETC